MCDVDLSSDWIGNKSLPVREGKTLSLALSAADFPFINMRLYAHNAYI